MTAHHSIVWFAREDGRVEATCSGPDCDWEQAGAPVHVANDFGRHCHQAGVETGLKLGPELPMDRERPRLPVPEPPVRDDTTPGGPKLSPRATRARVDRRQYALWSAVQIVTAHFASPGADPARGSAEVVLRQAKAFHEWLEGGE